MSRNFELLTEVERELSARTLPSTTRRDFSFVFGDSVRGPLKCGEEEMRQLVQRVFLSSKDNAPRRVLFFGVDAASDSSRVCAAAGRLLSCVAERNVCVVDANMRSSRLTSLLSVDDGARRAHRGVTAPELFVQVEANLYLARLCDIPAGAGELPSLDEMHRFFTALDEKFEYVLIDGSDANSNGDALVLSTLAQGSILVVEAHHTRKLNAHSIKEKCDAAGVRLLGTVLDNRTFPIPERLYRMF